MYLVWPTVSLPVNLQNPLLPTSEMFSGKSGGSRDEQLATLPTQIDRRKNAIRPIMARSMWPSRSASQNSIHKMPAATISRLICAPTSSVGSLPRQGAAVSHHRHQTRAITQTSLPEMKHTPWCTVARPQPGLRAIKIKHFRRADHQLSALTWKNREKNRERILFKIRPPLFFYSPP
jgi:hypothetical protein